MADFYAARSNTISPLQWSNLSPPYTNKGIGVDASVGIEVGFLEGGAENLNGLARNVNVGGGAPLGGSLTGTVTQGRNGETIVGGAVALEAGVTPLSASTTVSQGFKFGVQDVIDIAVTAVTDLFKEEKPTP